MASILANVDKDILEKNVTIIANVLSIDKGKATALVSALLTIDEAMDNASETDEEGKENETENENEPAPATSGGGVSTSSPYSL